MKNVAEDTWMKKFEADFLLHNMMGSHSSEFITAPVPNPTKTDDWIHLLPHPLLHIS